MVIIHAGTPTRSRKTVSGAIAGNPLIAPIPTHGALNVVAADAAGSGVNTSNRWVS
jgi:hypothetical protein